MERKLYDEPSATFYYQMHYNNSSYCITKKEYKTNGVTILEETYFKVFDGRDQIHNLGRVNKIRDKILQVGFDSMKMEEKIKSYYKNGCITKMEIAGRDGQIYSSTEIAYLKNYVVGKNYDVTKQRMKLRRVDSFIYNRDTTVVRWVIMEPDKNEIFENRFVFKDSVARMYEDDSLLKVIRIDRKFGLQQLISNNLQYNDPIHNCEFLNWERAAIVSIDCGNGNSFKNVFLRDAYGNIIERNQYRNGIEASHAVYTNK
jgi:hypothetical protein